MNINGLILVVAIATGVSALRPQPAAPSAEQLRLATKIVERTDARASMKQAVDHLYGSAIKDLKRDYSGSGIGKWVDAYAAKLADTQYQQILAGLAQMPVVQLESVEAGLEKKGGREALQALETGNLADQASVLGSIDDKGVTIADVDTGINMTSAEFAGRISPDSGGFDQTVARCAACATETVHYDANDVIGHGTETAAIAAAARNASGILGMAPGATILALNISAPNLSGVTPTSGPIPQSDSPNTALIAPAITYAVAHGAFVVSLSLNGAAGGQIAADQKAAMDGVRTSDRLLVESVSNIAGQDSFSGQVAQNLVGADLSNKAWFLFAIRVDAHLDAPVSNGLPGALADRTLAVVASSIQSIDKNGNPVTVDGNSFAAPAVAGASALLKQYWPTLGGAKIAQILLDTATDLGTPGVDQTYGVGLLNVAKAMQAQASPAAFASAVLVLDRYSSLTTSAPFGGPIAATAIGARVGHMTVFDVYGRNYSMASASGIHVRSSGLLAGAMLTPADPPWLATATTERRLGMVSDPSGPWANLTANRPAFASFSPAPGQTLTVNVNAAIAQGAGIAGSPLRGIGVARVFAAGNVAGATDTAGFLAIQIH